VILGRLKPTAPSSVMRSTVG